MAGLLGGVLPAVYSYGNTMQRKLKGLLADPLGTVGLGIIRAGEDDKQTSNLAYEAGYMPGSRSVLVSPEQKALARALLSQKMTEMGGGMLGTFIGPGAKTWDALANSRAVKMEAAGVDPRVIWKDTMNWRGPDGKWRQEIDDSGAEFPLMKSYRRAPFDHLAIHEPLEAAYPDIKNIILEGSPGGKLSGGSYTANVNFHDFGPRENILIRNSDESRIGNKSIGLHELQHAIQQREGFAAGGSHSDPAVAKAWVGKMLADAPAKYADISRQWEAAVQTAGSPIAAKRQNPDLWKSLLEADKWNEAAKLNGTKDSAQGAAMIAGDYLSPDKRFEAYRRLAGEAEARATQARMNLDAAQRRGLFPADSYDVPLDSLIVRYGNEPTNALVQALRGPR